MKKLIPALAMLLVAAALMGTSTYAWFSANTSVTASGMKVQAVSDGGLAIATSSTKNTIVTDDSLYSSSIDATDADINMWTNGATKIAPTSKDIDGDWWKATSNNPADAAAAAGTYAVAVTNADADGDTTDAGKGYFYQTQFSIKSLKQNASLPLYVSNVTVTGGTGNELDYAVRVAVECDGVWHFYAPNRSTADIKYYDGNNTTAATPASYPAATAADDKNMMHFGEGTLGATDNTLATLTYDAPVLVNVYLYYEGEDASCKSQLATNITDLVLSITFTAN